MKVLRLCIVFCLMFSIAMGMASCGKKDASSEQLSGNQAVEDSTGSAQGSEDVRAKSDIEDLMGEWTGVNASDRFVRISKTDAGYLYEDNEGKYPAEFNYGMLIVKVSDSDYDTADVYIHSKTGHLISEYQGETAEYQKK